MVNLRCAACGNTKNVFKFPTDYQTVKHWRTFLCKVLNTGCLNLRKSMGVCKEHFREEDFKNYSAWKAKKQKGPAR